MEYFSLYPVTSKHVVNIWHWALKEKNEICYQKTVGTSAGGEPFSYEGHYASNLCKVITKLPFLFPSLRETPLYTTLKAPFVCQILI